VGVVRVVFCDEWCVVGLVFGLVVWGVVVDVWVGIVYWFVYVVFEFVFWWNVFFVGGVCIDLFVVVG